MVETNGWFSRWESVVDSLRTVEEVFTGMDVNLESCKTEWDCAFVTLPFDGWERFDCSDRFWRTFGVILIVVIGGNSVVVWEMIPDDVTCFGRSFEWDDVCDCDTDVTPWRGVFEGTLEEDCSSRGIVVTSFNLVWTTEVVDVFWVTVVDPFDELFNWLVVCVGNLVTFWDRVAVDVANGGTTVECGAVVPFVEPFKILVFDGNSVTFWETVVAVVDGGIGFDGVLSGEICHGWLWYDRCSIFRWSCCSIFANESRPK